MEQQVSLALSLNRLIQQGMQKQKNFKFSPCCEQQLPTPLQAGTNTPTTQKGLKVSLQVHHPVPRPKATQRPWLCPWGSKTSPWEIHALAC